MNKGTKIQKGQFGYMKAQKKREIIKTILFFGISLAIFAMGIWSTGSKKNLLSIVAILGMLPASKSAVSMIMYLRVKECSKEIYEKIKPHTEGLTVLYELVLTTYEQTFPISSLAVCGNNIVGFAERKCDVNAAAKHIEEMLKQNSYKKETVKIFDNLEKYLNRLDQLSEKAEVIEGEEDSTPEKILQKNLEIAELIKQISL